MSPTHEELVRLAEAVPDDQVPAAEAFLRQLVRPTTTARREFSCTGTLDEEPDLAQRAKQVVREELGRSKQAE